MGIWRGLTRTGVLWLETAIHHLGEALYGDLRASQLGGTPTPTPPAEPRPHVQPPHTAELLAGSTLDIDTYQQMRDADPLLKAGTPLGDLLRSRQPLDIELQTAWINGCHAATDGECNWHRCPQLRDHEPDTTGRHCPLDIGDDER